MAGVLFTERVFQLASSLYGCHNDADFPQLILISFPFSDMLSSEVDAPLLRQELNSTLERLRKNGAAVLSIACNTLHAFLEEVPKDLVHLPAILKEALPIGEKPLVLCTTTSAKFGLHKRFFPCSYPSIKTQVEVDRIIDQILRGVSLEVISQDLLKILESEKAHTIILGCTELSLTAKYLSQSKKRIFDPLEIAARKVLDLSFAE